MGITSASQPRNGSTALDKRAERDGAWYGGRRGSLRERSCSARSGLSLSSTPSQDARGGGGNGAPTTTQHPAISTRRRAASQANGRKSRGPVTLEGKQADCQDARAKRPRQCMQMREAPWSAVACYRSAQIQLAGRPAAYTLPGRMAASKLASQSAGKLPHSRASPALKSRFGDAGSAAGSGPGPARGQPRGSRRRRPAGRLRSLARRECRCLQFVDLVLRDSGKMASVGGPPWG